MLGSMPVVAFVPCTNPERIRPFYEETLGLHFVTQDAFAIVFEADGVMVRVVNVAGVPGHKPAPFTILGWLVTDIEDTVRALVERGVEFQRYPGMDRICSASGPHQAVRACVVQGSGGQRALGDGILMRSTS